MSNYSTCAPGGEEQVEEERCRWRRRGGAPRWCLHRPSAAHHPGSASHRTPCSPSAPAPPSTPNLEAKRTRPVATQHLVFRRHPLALHDISVILSLCINIKFSQIFKENLTNVKWQSMYQTGANVMNSAMRTVPPVPESYMYPSRPLLCLKGF